MERASARMRDAAAEYGRLRPAIEAGAPWPLAERFGTEPEASWGPAEVLAHVTEMLPYWLGEAERVLAGSQQPVPFGRVASDPVRSAIIERDRTVPPRELLDRIDSDVARYERRLASLSAADLARRGLHPKYEEMTVAEILESFVVGHLEDHAAQLRDAVRAG